MSISTITFSNMINSKKFVTRNQQSFELKMNEETIIRVAEKVQISENNDQVKCMRSAHRHKWSNY